MGPAMPGGIPWASVRDWCEFHDLPGQDVPFLDTCCAAMDIEYMEWFRLKTEAAGK